jgi:ESS family glutamate:Na+ symporter
MTTGYFWDTNIWSGVLMIGVLLTALLFAHALKQNCAPLRKTLIPASVLGGLILLIISAVCKVTVDTYFFDLFTFTSGKASGTGFLEMLTYHCLAIGFIAMTLRKSKEKLSKGRMREIFNTGITTVSTYLLQAEIGMIIASVALLFLPNIINAAGVLLALGFGQSTGQALNYGALYEAGYGFIGGKSFGLSIAALGFLCASTVGVIYLNYLKRNGKIVIKEATRRKPLKIEDVEGPNEIPANESLDKLSVQVGLIFLCYLLAYGFMYFVGSLLGTNLKATIYGFNFLIGVFMAVLVKNIILVLQKRNIIKKDYTNDYLLNRISGLAFDLMIVTGISAIQIELIRDYWLVLLVMAVIGCLITFLYVRFVTNKLFPAYKEQQFMVMFGMLTGTASTGVILLREIDGNFETPASENLVYQNIPAIIFGFPIMILASYAPVSTMTGYITMGLIALFFVALNVLLFRSFLFRKRA